MVSIAVNNATSTSTHFQGALEGKSSTGIEGGERDYPIKASHDANVSKSFRRQVTQVFKHL